MKDFAGKDTAAGDRNATMASASSVGNSDRAENASDDEILGIGEGIRPRRYVDENSVAAVEDASVTPSEQSADTWQDKDPNAGADETEAFGEILDANPRLRAAWNDAQEYRETFATPEKAREAIALIGDLNHMDALFFSGRSEDHAELAKSLATLEPKAFASLARAMNAEVAKIGSEAPSTKADKAAPESIADKAPVVERDEQNRPGKTPSAAHEEFFQGTNAAAVQAVVDAIETQVERLLPEGASKTTRNRVVGEIYRELDVTLRDNRQLAQQVREAVRSGTLDAAHQRAIVSLITGRARQALPNVAKKVMEEWTSTILAADRGRRARQRTAEQRVDIVGSGGGASDGRRGATPRDIDYARLSDGDILNL